MLRRMNRSTHYYASLCRSPISLSLFSPSLTFECAWHISLIARFLLAQPCCSLNVMDVLHDIQRYPCRKEEPQPSFQYKDLPTCKDMVAIRQSNFFIPHLEHTGRMNTSSTISSDSADEFLHSSVPTRAKLTESLIMLPKHREKRVAERQLKARRRRRMQAPISRDLESSKSASDSTESYTKGKAKVGDRSARNQANCDDIDRVRVCDLPSRIGSGRGQSFGAEFRAPTPPLPSSQQIAVQASSSLSSNRRDDEYAEDDSDSSFSCWGTPSQLLPAEAWEDLEYDGNPLPTERSSSLKETFQSRPQDMWLSTPPRTPTTTTAAAAALLATLNRKDSDEMVVTRTSNRASPPPTAKTATPMAEGDVEPLEMTFSHLSIEVGDISIEHCFSEDESLQPPYFVGVSGVDNDLNSPL